MRNEGSAIAFAVEFTSLDYSGTGGYTTSAIVCAVEFTSFNYSGAGGRDESSSKRALTKHGKGGRI
jgi:hypothetical protein